jgi:hypothetical protein
MANTTGLGIPKPNNLSAQSATALLRSTWSAEFQLEALQSDVLIGNPAFRGVKTIDAGAREFDFMPKSCITDLTPAGKDKGSRYVIAKLLKTLQGSGKQGNAQSQMTGAEALRLKFSKFSANDWSHAVAGESYGIDFRELDGPALYKYVKQLLPVWLGETYGLSARQAICENRSSNLTVSPLSLSQGINQNVFFPALTFSNQPYQDTQAANLPVAGTAATAADAALYTSGGDLENIGNAAETLGDTTTSANHFTVAKMIAFLEYLQQKYIMTTEVAGKQVYPIFMHPEEYDHMLDPSVTGSWGAAILTGSRIEDLTQLIPGEIALIHGCGLCIKDRRAPTFSLSGSNSSWNGQFGYMRQGRNDTRCTTRVANKDFNVNYVLSPGAVVKLEPELPHFEEQDDEFLKYNNIGYFGAFSHQTCVWDLDTATSTSSQQETSLLALTSRI